MTPDPTPLVDMRGIEKRFPGVHALKSVSFALLPGEVHALMGENGAGKSTLMKILSGIYQRDGGEVRIDGASTEIDSPKAAQAAGLSIIHQELSLMNDLTVAQNIELGAYKRKDRPEASELETILDRFPRLRERMDSPAGLLSGGEQQMMAIARGLMAKPRLLLLDEPSLGLAPAMVEELYAVLAEMRDDGITILLVDQMATLALAVADRAYVLEQGRIVAQGNAEEMRGDDALVAAYLGGGTSQTREDVA